MRVLEGKAACQRVAKLSQRGQETSSAEKAAISILRDVRCNGDSALRTYACRWDKLKPNQSLRITPEQMESAWETIGGDLRQALQCAAKRIRRFCRWQLPREWIRSNEGIRLGQIVRPLDSVGCYVPGGKYSLPSTLLMTVIPAQVAGVREIRLASPNPQTPMLAAAAMLGIRDFYPVGGAQAVAALAYGTESIPRVQKIVGPGNSFVTAAKKLVSSHCAIDMLAGPTETLILLDHGDPEFIAADLVAQAEHDLEALPIFVTSSLKLAREVSIRVAKLSAKNSTARAAWRKNGVVLLAASHAQAIQWANQIAPEHITISRKDLGSLSSAGSVFIGDYSAQPAGDYATGPNHVLPTAGSARVRGGLSVLDFVKIITVQEVSAAGAKRIAPTVMQLAQVEGLAAHAESMRLRCQRA
jgi:histidinol dehydrogenase